MPVCRLLWLLLKASVAWLSSCPQLKDINKQYLAGEVVRGLRHLSFPWSSQFNLWLHISSLNTDLGAVPELKIRSKPWALSGVACNYINKIKITFLSDILLKKLPDLTIDHRWDITKAFIFGHTNLTNVGMFIKFLWFMACLLKNTTMGGAMVEK